MLKAMLVVTALGGGGDYTAEMPSMKECLDARIVIAEQDASLKTLCVPMADDQAKVREFFEIFNCCKISSEIGFNPLIQSFSTLPKVSSPLSVVKSNKVIAFNSQAT